MLRTCLMQADSGGGSDSMPGSKDAFTMLMQQARQEQSKFCSTSIGAQQKPQAPTDALTFLMQQARNGHCGNGSAPSTSGYALI